MSTAQVHDPMQIIRGREADSLGLDRRRQRRAEETEHANGGHDAHAVVAAAHRPTDGVLALCTVNGWALVRAISLAPQGILLRHVEAMDRGLEPEIRMQINAALQSLSPVLGAPLRTRGGSSPLANVGTHVLGGRVVADASAWSSGNARPGGRKNGDPLAVSLVLAPRGRTQVRGMAQLAQIEGRLAPLNDPDPRVLAVALVPRAVEELRLHLRDPRGPAARARASR